MVVAAGLPRYLRLPCQQCHARSVGGLPGWWGFGAYQYVTRLLFATAVCSWLSQVSRLTQHVFRLWSYLIPESGCIIAYGHHAIIGPTYNIIQDVGLFVVLFIHHVIHAWSSPLIVVHIFTTIYTPTFHCSRPSNTPSLHAMTALFAD